VLAELERLRWDEQPLKVVDVSLDTRRDDPTQDAWRRNIQTVLSEIRQKNCEKVVLARKTNFVFKKPLNPWLIAQQLKNVTPNSYHFCFQFNGERLFLGASPERLFIRAGNAVESEALAGTRARGKTDSDDNRLKGELKSSGKEQHEHKVVVNMINEGLKPLCQKVMVHPQEIISVPNGHHLKTRFQGLLNDGVQDEEIFQALHPTPAVGGSPTEEALGLIEELEGFSRGWYTGAIGYVGLEQTEFVVAIRSAMVQDRQMTVYAGAGIVEGSTAKDEWQEIEHKIGNFLRVLNVK
nr:isochorismate synthase [Candidatus Omnitrophota bacterium]